MAGGNAVTACTAGADPQLQPPPPHGKRDRAGSAVGTAVASPEPPRRAAGASDLLKLSPVGAEQADYWNQALGDGVGLGVNDFSPKELHYPLEGRPVTAPTAPGPRPGEIRS